MRICRLKPVKTIKIDPGKICPDHVSVEKKTHGCHFTPKFVSNPNFKTQITPQTPVLGFSLWNENDHHGINQNIAFYQRMLLESRWLHD